MEDWSNCRLVNLLQRCLQSGPEDLIWDRLIAEVNRIITPRIRVLLTRLLAKRARVSALGFWLSEVEDLQQMIWYRMLRREAWVLRRFQGEQDGALTGYLIRVTVTVVQNYFRQPAVQARAQWILGLDVQSERLAPRAHRIGQPEGPLQAAIWFQETRAMLRSQARKEVAARAVRIFEFRREGYSPAEISRRPGMVLGERAVRKICAQQSQISRKTLL